MRIVLCDDHQMLIEALATILSARGHQVEAAVTDPSTIGDIVAEKRPDVCILDIAFPNGDGIEAVREVVARSPQTKTLMLSACVDPEQIRQAFEAGALGFVAKDESIDSILTAIARLQDGDVVIDPRLLRAAMQACSTPADRYTPERLRYLTHRERDVLRCIVAGHGTSHIAYSLGVATSTARTHIQNVLVKLGVHSRLEAASVVVREGLLEYLEELDSAGGDSASPSSA